MPRTDTYSEVVRTVTSKNEDIVGRLHYDRIVTVTVDDRALAHLKLVIATKLRRGEGFLFSWDKSVEEGSGRGSVWMSSASILYFEFDGGSRPRINREWLEMLAQTANGNGGLTIVPEPPAAPEE